MTQMQIGGMIRSVGLAFGGVLVTLGYASAGNIESLVGVAAMLGMTAWSWYSNRTTVMVSAVAGSNLVKKVVMTNPDDARADANPKVVAA